MTEKDSGIRLINKSRFHDEFLPVHNRGFIRDTRLSLKAKGLLTLMLTNKDDWMIHLNEIENHSSDGIAALYSGCKELIACKYIRKVQNRDEKGHFKETFYYIFDEPYDGSVIPVYVKSNESGSPFSDFPHADFPHAGFPFPENRTLTNNNYNNNNLNKTKLTNSNSQTVSESVFVNLIKELFSGDYPFDKNFESDVMKRLESSQIETENLEAFLKYVFERTKVLNPSKSFEGLYRKLALSSSIATDFKLSLQNKKSETQESNKIAFKKINCSICGTEFNEIDYYCPTCGASLKAINGEDKIEYQVHKKLFEMSPDEKQNYEQAYSTWEQQTKKKTGRLFLLTNERIQFWKDYGILPAETEEN